MTDSHFLPEQIDQLLDDPATLQRIYAGTTDEEELVVALPDWMDAKTTTPAWGAV